ncbi:restriction endonuclease subunit S [Kaistella yonginensis]|uniref:restriction endonuclease subunit S n=1 Tax=Kaistella yonginensis TaxID=658267 RepID=UPI0025B2A1CB|nr:restriction endonuclease subunit S [Kaistella yonginensis]MDN3605853.1 restriction endonuclease subunit S [Kaistella yonginensis]
MHNKYRLKHLFVKRIGGAWGNEPDKNNEGYACLRAADILTDQMRHKSEDLTYRVFSEQEIKTRKLLKGDLLIEKSGGGENQPVGRIALFDLNEEQALCSNFLDLLRPNKSIVNSAYIAYILYYLWKTKVVNLSIKQTTGIQNLDIEDYFNNAVFIPSLEQQNKIVAYLDKEVDKIDSLIEKKTKLLELLEEKKKATISQAVTKGLNPNAKMKPSGIEWLGDIPEHWELTKFKYITSKIGSGVTPSGGAEIYKDEGILFLRSQNIYNENLRLDDRTYIPVEIHDKMKSSQLIKNDLLLNITGGSIGRCFYFELNEEANINQHVCIIRCNEKAYYKYLHKFLISAFGQYQIDNLQYGGGREAISFENIKNFVIPIPSYEEQLVICNDIDNTLAEFNSILNKTTYSIKLLKEKRTAIISAAINGELNL